MFLNLKGWVQCYIIKGCWRLCNHGRLQEETPLKPAFPRTTAPSSPFQFPSGWDTYKLVQLQTYSRVPHGDIDPRASIHLDKWNENNLWLMEKITSRVITQHNHYGTNLKHHVLSLLTISNDHYQASKFPVLYQAHFDRRHIVMRTCLDYL